MRSNELKSLLTTFFLILLTGFINSLIAEVVVYPSPPGLLTSPDFTIIAGSQQIWVERISSSLKKFDYELYSGREMEDLNVASFSCSGAVNITGRS